MTMVVAITCAVVIAAVIFVLGCRAQRQAVGSLAAALEKASKVKTGLVQGSIDYDSLPPPVQRYLHMALPDGFETIGLAHLRQEGRLRLDAKTERWMTFTAEQTIAPTTTGFLWDARVRATLGIHIRVLDSLVDGRGAGQVSLLSAIRIASDGGTPEMNSGALHRFLAETVWSPTALLPSERLRWSAIDDRTACATLTVHDVTVSLEFRFNAAGEVVGIFTPGRWGSFGGSYVQKPWEGRFREYVPVQGMRIPKHGEVGWYDGSVWGAVWEGTLLEAQYSCFR
ncbi:DUF6544 family protein [Polaromonas sp.]|uniref:DUF6544 family protein n=1 Tax=Polaromonas sp. TaxID=1869339 RepID=UPI0013BBA3AB|nr:DUF6544 family protein [Polaromonas sp.]NDP62954.1 hypothetical protein [Polaromonas sp.]